MNQVKLFKALSDYSRLNIIRSLLEGPKYVELLSERLNLAKSTVSFHLKKLEEVNLVSSKKEQYYIVYSINKDVLENRLISLISFDEEQLQSEKLREDEYIKNIEEEFIEDNRLKSIPIQRKKKTIVLSKIAEIFEEEVYYSESDINEKLMEIYPNFNELRKELVFEKLLLRSRGYYLRVRKK